MAKGLSKSRYTQFCQCPKALWLRVNKPDEATVDAGVEARFESGNEVGDLAMGLFGPFVEVTTKRKDGGLDLKVMVDRTKEEMISTKSKITSPTKKLSSPLQSTLMVTPSPSSPSTNSKPPLSFQK